MAESSVASSVPEAPPGLIGGGVAEGSEQAERAEPAEPEGGTEAASPRRALLSSLSRRQLAALIVSVFVTGLCSLIYELLIGSISSYFLGDGVLEFSITIGIFMASMGLGSYFSRHLARGVLTRFIAVETVLGIIGGLCAPALYFVYAVTTLYYPAMIVSIVAVGTLTGLEVPLLVLAMREHFSLEKNVSNILSLDYLGALAATFLFPFVLLPFLGTFRTSLATGVVNLAVAVLALVAFRSQLSARWRNRLYGVIGVGALVMIAGFVLAPRLLKPWHKAAYEDHVIFVRQSKYQHIVITRGRNDIRLFLNGNLQFSSIDEYRYHEPLIEIPMALAPHHENILMLGGGDGLAVREILKHKDVKHITLVDIDPAMTKIAKTQHFLRQLNKDSLYDPRVEIVHQDAFIYLRTHEKRWDLIVADLPDPNDVSLSRLYSMEFYGLIERHLAREGLFVTQATSPYFAKKAFWCIEATVHAAGFQTLPYHAYVPSFGDWGFVIGTTWKVDPSHIHIDVPTRYLTDEKAKELFTFAKDLARVKVAVSTLDDPRLLRYYLNGWENWGG